MKYLLSIAFIVFGGCTDHAPIPISNTLELAIESRYNSYVLTLNKACRHDSIALVEFLKIDYINDAAGYDHGYVLFQLMKNNGDKEFSNALKKLNKSQLNTVRNYIEVGLDADDEGQHMLNLNFPISASILNSN